MALSRYLLNDLLRSEYDPFYQHNLVDDLLSRCQAVSSTPNYLHSLVRAAGEPQRGVIANISNQKDAFKVNLDVQHFKPDDLSLKVVDDYLVVEGKHEEKQDKHGYISRQFTRRYKLPDNVNLDAISSTISSDGVLSIIAPKKAEAIENGRQVPIVQVNQPAIKQTNKESASGSSGPSENMES